MALDALGAAGANDEEKTAEARTAARMGVSLMSDEARGAAYRLAVETQARDTDLVLDVGGGVGLLGVVAARAGAKRVVIFAPTTANLASSVALANNIPTDSTSSTRASPTRAPTDPTRGASARKRPSSARSSTSPTPARTSSSPSPSRRISSTRARRQPPPRRPRRSSRPGTRASPPPPSFARRWSPPHISAIPSPSDPSATPPIPRTPSGFARRPERRRRRCAERAEKTTSSPCPNRSRRFASISRTSRRKPWRRARSCRSSSVTSKGAPRRRRWRWRTGGRAWRDESSSSAKSTAPSRLRRREVHRRDASPSSRRRFESRKTPPHSWFPSSGTKTAFGFASPRAPRTRRARTRSARTRRTRTRSTRTRRTRPRRRRRRLTTPFRTRPPPPRSRGTARESRVGTRRRFATRGASARVARCTISGLRFSPTRAWTRATTSPRSPRTPPTPARGACSVSRRRGKARCSLEDSRARVRRRRRRPRVRCSFFDKTRTLAANLRTNILRGFEPSDELRTFGRTSSRLRPIASVVRSVRRARRRRRRKRPARVARRVQRRRERGRGRQPSPRSKRRIRRPATEAARDASLRGAARKRLRPRRSLERPTRGRGREVG